MKQDKRLAEIVGGLDLYYPVTTSLLEDDLIEFVDVMPLIQSYHFKIKMRDQNIERTADFNKVNPMQLETDYTSLAKELDAFFDKYDLEKANARMRKNLAVKEVKAVLKQVGDAQSTLDTAQVNWKQNQRDQHTAKLFEENEIPLAKVPKLKNFDWAYGALTEDASKTIKADYENIPGLVIHLGDQDAKKIYLLVYPKRVENAINRLKHTIHWDEIPLLEDAEGSNTEILAKLKDSQHALEKERDDAEKNMRNTLQANEDLLLDARYSVGLLAKAERAQRDVACSTNNFYMAGWMDAADIEKVQSRLAAYDNILLKVLTEEEMPQDPNQKHRHFRLPLFK